MSGDKEQEYFSDGLAEEIINALTNLPGLRVAGRTSSFFSGARMLNSPRLEKNSTSTTSLKAVFARRGAASESPPN
jgi:TolB-like protein